MPNLLLFRWLQITVFTKLLKQLDADLEVVVDDVSPEATTVSLLMLLATKRSFRVGECFSSLGKETLYVPPINFVIPCVNGGEEEVSRAAGFVFQ